MTPPVHVEAPDGLLSASKRYSVILADPPWEYHQPVARIRRHYQLMPLESLVALPVQHLCERDAALFLWATAPRLPDALALMGAWGFAYKGVAFTWIKMNRNRTPFMGMGAYTRANAEICLLGLRGKVARKAKNVPQAMVFPRREHSRKPDQQYGRIMRLFDGPYLEMFARQRWPGWDVWGNQLDLFPAQPFLIDEATA